MVVCRSQASQTDQFLIVVDPAGVKPPSLEQLIRDGSMLFGTASEIATAKEQSAKNAEAVKKAVQRMSGGGGGGGGGRGKGSKRGGRGGGGGGGGGAGGLGSLGEEDE